MTPQERYEQGGMITIKELLAMKLLPYGMDRTKKMFTQGAIKSKKMGVGGKRFTCKEWVQEHLTQLKNDD